MELVWGLTIRWCIALLAAWRKNWAMCLFLFSSRLPYLRRWGERWGGDWLFEGIVSSSSPKPSASPTRAPFCPALCWKTVALPLFPPLALKPVVHPRQCPPCRSFPAHFESCLWPALVSARNSRRIPFPVGSLPADEYPTAGIQPCKTGRRQTSRIHARHSHLFQSKPFIRFGNSAS